MNNLTTDQLLYVCMTYEEIKRRRKQDKLTKVSIENLDEIPKMSGIYFVETAKGKVLYIGMSKNLSIRCNLISHHKLLDALEYGASFLTLAKVDESIVAYVEKVLITEFNPELNQIHARVDESRVSSRLTTWDECIKASPLLSVDARRALMKESGDNLNTELN